MDWQWSSRLWGTFKWSKLTKADESSKIDVVASGPSLSNVSWVVDGDGPEAGAGVDFLIGRMRPFLTFDAVAPPLLILLFACCWILVLC